MPEPLSSRGRILFGFLAGLLAPILFLIGEFFLEDEGVLFDAAGNPEAFSALVTSPAYAFWAARGLVGVPLEVLGVIATYIVLAPTRAEGLAFWGLVATLIGDVAGVSMFSTMLFEFPARGALWQSGVLNALEGAEVSPLVLLVNLVGTLGGLLLLALAIARTDVLPRASGWLILIGFALVPIPLFAAQLAANGLYLVGAAWQLAHAWRTV